MDVIHFSEAKRNLGSMLDRIIDDAIEGAIASRNRDPVAIISLARWNSVRERLHLVSSPANARRLSMAIRRLDGVGLTRKRCLDFRSWCGEPFTRRDEGRNLNVWVMPS